MRPSPARSLLLACLLTACADKSGGNRAGEEGGTIVIANAGTTAPLLPPLAQDGVTRNIADQVYDRLAQIGPDLNPFGDEGFQPRLAQSWSWATDSLSVAFSIDPRARWHDGQPVRANDVRFSFDMIKDPKTGTSLTPLVQNVDSVSVRDSLTAVAWFHQRKPEQFFDLVYSLHVMPEHVLKDIARETLVQADLSQRLIGSGRFRLARFEPGVRVELIADTTNYRGRPKLDRVIWAMSSDAGSAITQLLSGQADVYENLPADVLPRVDSSGRVRAERFKGLAVAYMGMNQRDPRRAGAPHPVFGDRQVRRAISMAMDRPAMLRNVFDTIGTLMKGPFPTILADTTVTILPFDRTRAAALLDSAGWRAGTDGMRVKNGRPLAFTLTVPTTSRPRMRYGVLIQEQLKALGVQVTLEPVEGRTFIDRLEARSFDAALVSFSVNPGLSGLKESWGTSGIARGGQNYLSYSNPVVDASVDSALATFDARRRTVLAHRAFQGIADDAPAVWLYDGLAMIGVNKRIRTADLRTDGWWAGLSDWWIPDGERIDRDRIGLRPAQP